MRTVLAAMRDRFGWSQTKVGDLLNIGQQAAGTILNKGGGFSRPTALHLAVLCGFDSPESLLADIGVKGRPEKVKTSSAWFERDIAAGYARRMQCDESAIQRVSERYIESSYTARPTKWWVERFIREDSELNEERRTRSEAPASSSSLPEPKRKARKRAG